MYKYELISLIEENIEKIEKAKEEMNIGESDNAESAAMFWFLTACKDEILTMREIRILSNKIKKAVDK